MSTKVKHKRYIINCHKSGGGNMARPGGLTHFDQYFLTDELEKWWVEKNSGLLA